MQWPHDARACCIFGVGFGRLGDQNLQRHGLCSCEHAMRRLRSCTFSPSRFWRSLSFLLPSKLVCRYSQFRCGSELQIKSFRGSRCDCKSHKLGFASIIRVDIFLLCWRFTFIFCRICRSCRCCKLPHNHAVFSIFTFLAGSYFRITLFDDTGLV